MFLGALAADVHLHDTYFVVAHMHYVMFGGTVMAFFGAMHYWFPKMFGRNFNEKIAKLAWLLVFVGFNVTFFIQHIIGTQGMPRRYASYPDEFTYGHLISTYGSWMLGVGILLMFANLLRGVFSGSKAERNPYKSLSPEWNTESPPPHENFDEIPTFTDWTYGYGEKKKDV